MQLLSNELLLQRRGRGQELLRAAGAVDSNENAVAVLATFNVDLLSPFLAERLDTGGRGATVYVGPYGQVAQEALAPDSGLYRCQPKHIVLVLAVEDLLAPAFERPAQFAATAGAELVAARLEELEAIVKALLERAPAAACHLALIEPLTAPNPHILNPRSDARGAATVAALKEGIEHFVTLSPRVVVMDWRERAAQIGGSHCRDPRLWYLARMRLNQQGLAQLADLTVRHISAYAGDTRKVIALDLDDTLWGGVIGEVGLAGIALGDEAIGLAFQDFQRELLKLHDAGILLALCSKNNSEDAWEAIDKHPGMVLRREHFAAARINWLDKATNLRDLAAELNVGIDAFIFLDDNPVERAWIGRSLPQVFTPELPEDPVERPGFLRELPSLARIDVTETDLSRAASYQAEGQRVKARANVESVADFIASLEQHIDFVPLTPATLNRAAQMCQRTNQFNLTTNRYTVGDLESLMNDARCEAFTVAVRDRFGDYGTVGLAILKFDGQYGQLDTLLLSCRVLGRGVEQSLLGELRRRAQLRGARLITGSYIRTSKNQPIATFLQASGIALTDSDAFSIPLEST